MVDERKKLLKLVKKKALTIGDITLSSGKKSNYYIDCRKITLDPEGAYLVASILLEFFREKRIDAVGGLTLGADPICGALAAVSYNLDNPLPAFIVRKKSKKHGTRNSVEGNLKPGYRVAVVDDVATSGGSLLQVVEIVQDMGCDVIKVVVIVDRDEGARELLAKKGIRLESIFSRADLGL